MISINKEMTVAEIVTENIKTADVFKRNGIDFCCGGKISLRSACEKKGLDYESIFSEIEKLIFGFWEFLLKETTDPTTSKEEIWKIK